MSRIEFHGVVKNLGYPRWNEGCDLHQKRIESADKEEDIICRLKQIGK